jgi:hypothetical protein
MAYRPGDRPTLLLTLPIAWVKDDARIVLSRVNALTLGSTALEIVIEHPDETQKLRFIVECRNHLMTTFMASWVVSVPTHDEPSKAIVIGVNPAHSPSMAP